MANAAQEITKAYQTWETQYGANSWMPAGEIENRTDLTREQIREGMHEIAVEGRGRRGSLAVMPAGIDGRM